MNVNFTSTRETYTRKIENSSGVFTFFLSEVHICSYSFTLFIVPIQYIINVIPNSSYYLKNQTTDWVLYRWFTLQIYQKRVVPIEPKKSILSHIQTCRSLYMNNFNTATQFIKCKLYQVDTKKTKLFTIFMFKNKNKI